MEEKLFHYGKVALLCLFIAWIVGNLYVTYKTGVIYSGEPNYDAYHESKGR